MDSISNYTGTRINTDNHRFFIGMDSISIIYLDRIYRIYRIYLYSLFPEETKNAQSPAANLMLSKFDINQFGITI